ncbi:hypothetical protein [Brevibacterium casei]|uniref:hypothetical protein n=1 Tax=Brevibacterium casei TaxID=33889 RepID=UPI00223C2F23|nr:hypothetical protein [Brevibacterium casei]MCT1549701.1 hypothetical protein [Brevibacterium casei]MCT1561404.1 hypothetical protein [Brevibacterium casei]MCT2207743.1 hypothetical protein [Brevibacterium casei]
MATSVAARTATTTASRPNHSCPGASSLKIVSDSENVPESEKPPDPEPKPPCIENVTPPRWTSRVRMRPIVMKTSGTTWPGTSRPKGRTKIATIDITATMTTRWTHATSRGGTAQRRNGAPIASVPLKWPATRPHALTAAMTSRGTKNERAVTAENSNCAAPPPSMSANRAAKMSWSRKSTMVNASAEIPIWIHVDPRLGDGWRRSLHRVNHHRVPRTTSVTSRGAPERWSAPFAEAKSSICRSKRNAAEPNRARAMRTNGRA